MAMLQSANKKEGANINLRVKQMETKSKVRNSDKKPCGCHPAKCHKETCNCTCHGN